MNAHKTIITNIALAMVLWIANPVQAAEFHVTTAQQFQTALSTAAVSVEDATIFLAAGIYADNFGFINTSSVEKTITIKSEDGVTEGQVILDGGQVGGVIYLEAPNENVSFVFEKITFQKGSTSSGGGLYINSSGNIDVTNCLFIGNTAYSNGGGVFINSSGTEKTINFTNNFISNNTIPTSGGNNGGGIHLVSSGPGSTIKLINNIITNNTTYGTHGRGVGGGVYVVSSQTTSTIILTDNSIAENSGHEYGGGVYVSFAETSGTTITLTNNDIKNNKINMRQGGGVFLRAGTISCTNNNIKNNSVGEHGGGAILYANTINFSKNDIKNNSSGYTGGGVSFSGTVVTLSDNNITENSSGSGGGIAIDAGTILLTNNIIAGNSASSSGGGLSVSPSIILNLINNTITENSVSGSGGGVYFNIGGGAVAHVYNNIIWGNEAQTDGDDIFIAGYGPTKEFYYNNFHEIAGTGTWDYSSGNNIDVAPLFVDSANGDYQLSAGSLCINAGTNTAPQLPSTDIDGYPRIGDGVVDMGAYEHSTTELHPADTNQNWNLEADESSAYGVAWKNGDTWASGPDPIPIDYVTRAGFLKESGGTYSNAGGGRPGCWVP